MSKLCKIFGHANLWGNAAADGGTWRSHCGRCGAALTRAVSGGGWRRDERSPTSETSRRAANGSGIADQGGRASGNHAAVVAHVQHDDRKFGVPDAEDPTAPQSAVQVES